ncbi:hypothetical protein C1Y63_02070 [Corynebacterium sp. 13CS0277]|uniref:hypothetical protein n=1 Tax=Corynebacterium sp. 13CS0277 TaxID=2071994 RepID=UPI000D030501|nr:hypothetical protein [Corynebacterium sp. 13CS0277]PRQ12123.1 hypothetical protein C1Y63_02070 [Corynebacterium sp. 13CS0277]
MKRHLTIAASAIDIGALCAPSAHALSSDGPRTLASWAVSQTMFGTDDELTQSGCKQLGGSSVPTCNNQLIDQGVALSVTLFAGQWVPFIYGLIGSTVGGYE